MAVAFLCTLVFTILSKNPRFEGSVFLTFPFSVAVTVMISLPVWVTVTLLTPPVGTEHLIRFCRRVRPGGRGWKHIYAHIPDYEQPKTGLKTFVRIVSGVIALNAILIGIGKIILGSLITGSVILAIALVSGLIFVTSLRGGLGGEVKES
jgi:hypothetical protein